jgi:cAMP-dependent protein kinase regulator
MTDGVREAKDRAAALLQKGKLAAALEQYQRVVKASPSDLGVRQKVAELSLKLGHRAEAVEGFFEVARRYAHGGQFFKAIALCKVVLSVEPANQAAQASLADLYSRAREVSRTAAAPPPRPPPPMAPLELEVFGPNMLDLSPDGGDEAEVLLEVEAVDEEPAPAPTPADLPVIPLFSQLERDDFIAVLREGMEVRSCAPGTAVVTEGDDGTAMFAIVQGQVGVLHEGRQVAQMAEGDFFGEMALISRSKRLATVKALTPAVLLEFPRAAMEKLFAQHPGIAVALDAFYRERLLANLMRCSPLLHALSDELKVELSGRFEVKTYDPGQVIMLQGQPGEGLYLIIRGRCEVMDRSGKRYPPLKEGDAFGEISVVTGRAATANVRAESQVVALRLPSDLVRARVLPHPGVQPLIDDLVNERLARTRALDLRV